LGEGPKQSGWIVFANAWGAANPDSIGHSPRWGQPKTFEVNRRLSSAKIPTEVVHSCGNGLRRHGNNYGCGVINGLVRVGRTGRVPEK